MIRTSRGDGRLEILELLRGVAALAVAWFHFTIPGQLVTEGSALWHSGRHGWMGVEVFFVISGFVIPYAMHRGGYRFPRDAGRFLLKRVIRLDPAYVASIALIYLLWWASSLVPWYRGTSPHVQLPQLLAHIGYLNAFIGYPWLNPVFWTLAIEFQYYLIVAVGFPVLVHHSPRVRTLAIALMALCAFAVAPTDTLVFRYGAFFALGALTFQRHVGLVPTRGYVLLVVPIALAAALAKTPLAGVVGLSTALCIAFVRTRRIAPFAWLGSVSYSVYLLHTTVGGRVINLGARVATSPAARLAVLLSAVGVSLVAAWVFYCLVERPAQRLAASITYGERESEGEERPDPVPAAAPAI
jgi:peptidoglycan/LPS O-acetylase OafA/YrhL